MDPHAPAGRGRTDARLPRLHPGRGSAALPGLRADRLERSGHRGVSRPDGRTDRARSRSRLEERRPSTIGRTMTDPAPSLATPYRTHTCGECATDAETPVRLVRLGAPAPRPRPADLPRPAGSTRDHPGRDRPDRRAGRPRGGQPGSPRVRRVGQWDGRAAPGRDREREAPDRRHRVARRGRRDPVRGQDAAVLHQRPGRTGRRGRAPEVPLPRHPPRADAAAPAPPQPDGPGDPRGPPRQRVRRGRDADPDQEHPGRRARLHRPEPAPAGQRLRPAAEPRSSSSSS